MRLIDADATKLAICRDECGADADSCNRMCCNFPNVIDEQPTITDTIDKGSLVKKIASLARVAKSESQLALLGRVLYIIDPDDHREENNGETD